MPNVMPGIENSELKKDSPRSVGLRQVEETNRYKNCYKNYDKNNSSLHQEHIIIR